MSLLSRLAPAGRGTDGKPFDYHTQRAADAAHVKATLSQLERAIKAREQAAARQRSYPVSDQRPR